MLMGVDYDRCLTLSQLWYCRGKALDLGSAPLAFDDPVRNTVQLQQIHRLLPEESVKAGPGWGRSGSSVCVRGI